VDDAGLVIDASAIDDVIVELVALLLWNAWRLRATFQ
jgi:hypothetical protein